MSLDRLRQPAQRVCDRLLARAQVEALPANVVKLG
jgi:hypothetical protein